MTIFIYEKNIHLKKLDNHKFDIQVNLYEIPLDGEPFIHPYLNLAYKTHNSTREDNVTIQ